MGKVAGDRLVKRRRDDQSDTDAHQTYQYGESQILLFDDVPPEAVRDHAVQPEKRQHEQQDSYGRVGDCVQEIARVELGQNIV